MSGQCEVQRSLANKIAGSLLARLGRLLIVEEDSGPGKSGSDSLGLRTNAKSGTLTSAQMSLPGPQPTRVLGYGVVGGSGLATPLENVVPPWDFQPGPDSNRT